MSVQVVCDLCDVIGQSFLALLFPDGSVDRERSGRGGQHETESEILSCMHLSCLLLLLNTFMALVANQ